MFEVYFLRLLDALNSFATFLVITILILSVWIYGDWKKKGRASKSSRKH